MSQVYYPRWKLPWNLPTFSVQLPFLAMKLNCRVINYRSDETFHLHYLKEKMLVVEISPTCGVLIIDPQALPLEFSEIPIFKDRIEAFMEEYSFSLVIWQGYQNSLTQMAKNLPKIALALRGMLMRHVLTYHQAMIPTRHLEDTALCLRSLAKRVQIVDNPPSNSRIKAKARRLYDAQQTLIEGFCLMGLKKFKLLSTEFQFPFEIMEEIRSSELLYTRTGNPKGITGRLKNIKLFDFEFIRQNQILLTKNNTLDN
ncbi:hypothetical protein NEF87_004793 [Candidatus Lokiarchaeum ossiferum]|uniref:Uncharacterized protein n=1 Tax=Candidatus Lokiarchaeum ossiferum TaxID=2951803 RepID=A0ABY6HYA3_9ARCH|nr:hypothetical protein NEF87_004793 [Candidatus Lokiarchaeum sp. B-35]